MKVGRKKGGDPARSYEGEPRSLGLGWQLAALAAVLLGAALVYANSLGGDFVWDDRRLIVNDRAIKSWSHLDEIFVSDFFGRNEDDLPYGYYRPLTTVSYLADFSLWALQPFGYHLSNVLFHMGCTLLVGLILLRLQWGFAAAIIAALLFAVHPIHTENVAWIAGRTDLLAFLFSAMALLAHLMASGSPAWSQHPPLHNLPRSRRFLLHGLAGLLFALALLAKEMSVVLIAWVGLAERLAYLRNWRAVGRALLPYLTIFAAYVVWRFQFVQIPVPGEPSEHRLSSVLLSMPPTVVRYLIWLAWPAELSAYVQNPYVTEVSDPRLWGALSLLLVLAALWYRFGRQSRRLLLAGGMLAASFIPIVNLVRIAGPVDMGNVMAERFCYFPSFPFVALVGLAAAGMLEQTARRRLPRVAVIAVLAVVVAGGALATVRRNRDWADELSFYTKTLDQSPTAALLWGNLATYHLRHKDLESAAVAIERAAALAPDSYAVLSSRALWYVVSGRLEEAVPLQEQIVAQARYGARAALNNLAFLYGKLGQRREAIEILQELVRDGHGYADAYFNLAQLYEEQGETEAARSNYELALRSRPNDLQIARALAELEIAAGRLDAAESVYRRMQRVHPADARLLNNLALVRYERGDLTEALDLLRQATALRPDYVNARINYAQLLERAGYPAQAVAQLEEALRRAGDDKLQQLAAERLDALRLRAGQGGAP